jgi:hypothetical protein
MPKTGCSCSASTLTVASWPPATSPMAKYSRPPHWSDPSRMTRYVRVAWDRVVAVEDRLPIDELLVEVLGHRWNAVHGSGHVLGPETAAALEARWADHVGSQSAEQDGRPLLGRS